jgi:ribosomal protein L7Ae-like RNA K-turn-binding protein
MARRAGKVASGESQVEAYFKKQKGHLLLIAEDSPGAATKFNQWANDIHIPVLVTGTKQELGSAIGLSPRSIVLIIDRGFAEAIIKAK